MPNSNATLYSGIFPYITNDLRKSITFKPKFHQTSQKMRFWTVTHQVYRKDRPKKKKKSLITLSCKVSFWLIKRLYLISPGRGKQDYQEKKRKAFRGEARFPRTYDMNWSIPYKSHSSEYFGMIWTSKMCLRSISWTQAFPWFLVKNSYWRVCKLQWSRPILKNQINDLLDSFAFLLFDYNVHNSEVASKDTNRRLD